MTNERMTGNKISDEGKNMVMKAWGGRGGILGI